jgi:hypothetical protein
MVGNLLLDRPPVLVPLPRRDLLQLRWRALGDAPVAAANTAVELRPEVTTKVMTALQARVQERALSEEEVRILWSPALQDFVRSALTRLATGLASLPPTLTESQSDNVPNVPGLVLS